MSNDLSKALAFVALLYGQESAKSLVELARIDETGAMELAAAALHPDALEMKHRIDKNPKET